MAPTRELTATEPAEPAATSPRFVRVLATWWSSLRRWPHTFAVFLAAAVGITAIWASQAYGVPMRDPDGFLGPAYIRLPLISLAFFAIGIVPMALRRSGVKHFGTGVRTIIRDEWTWSRFVHVLVGLVTFYVSYVSYRNLKSLLPVIRPRANFDNLLSRLDYWLMFGHYPSQLLHSLLGTGFVAQILATVYVTYLMAIPITLGAILVLHRKQRIGAWYSTALSLNWILGAISYYILPTQGPAFFAPQLFADLPTTAASELQQSLFNSAVASQNDPSRYTYGIAGFASLHVSVSLMAVLFFYRAGFAKWIRRTALVFFVLTTTATLYFGWHYIADDVAGAAIGWFSVALAGWATGHGFWRRRRRAVQAPPADAQPA